MGLGTLALVAIAFGCYLPAAQFLRLPQQIGQCLIQQGATHPGDAVMIQYKEGSIVYYQGGTLRPEADDAFLRKNPDPARWPTWMVITDAIWNNAPPEVQRQLTVVQRFHGVNYAGAVGGKRVIDVMVVAKK